MAGESVITASEIGTYLFCKRAWFLGCQGASSSLEGKQSAGVEFHDACSGQVQTAKKAGRLATGFAVISAILIAVALLLAIR